MIDQKITQEDLCLYEIMRNPTLFGEFVYNYDKLEYEEKFEFTSYQREMLSDFSPYQVFCTARATGKTVSLTSIILWLLTNSVFPDQYILLATPSKVHLQPVWDNLIRYYRSNTFLKNFIAPSSGINSSDFIIKLLNRCELYCRIAGQTGTGANLVGLHTAWIMVDEAGYFPHNAFQEMQPCLNTFTSGYREMLAGVPSGVRERNILFMADQVNSDYSKHRVSALENPRLTKKDIDSYREQYGGEDTDDWIHYVLGQHGRPVFSLFDRNSFQLETYPVYRSTINGIQVQDNLAEYISRISLIPGLPNKDSKCILGIDLGYTEPTAMVVLYLDHHGSMKFHARLRLDKVSYPIQERIIDMMDSKFNPMIIGIDAGGVGKPVVQSLLENSDFIHKDYNRRIVPVDFSSQIVIGMDASGEEVKSKTKPFATSILQDYSDNHRLIYSYTDLEMITELERMIYTKGPSGDISYKTLTQRGGQRGEDHFTAALLCAVMAYYVKTDFMAFKTERKKLASPTWF